MNWKTLRSPSILFWGYCILILIGSSIPATSMPKLEVLTFDKVIHFSEYTVFGWLYLRFYQESRVSKKWKLLILVPILFPLLDETWQQFIPGRDSSIFDSIADWIGIAFGYGLGYFLSLHD
ncbi:MAG: VanZ family protein [FCB group bacterium]|nr:VanZ family protein [FCB group bacterium]